ncbi:hypothetical protein AJ79_07191 [Helicocarpus griseus UAMH5409]|uniref:Uncharacterized protein n=1 Tax=Helicocarpus griseus UAMH5409 TaxID=1447875 RepID=A0A2B7X5N5_9EURO|nr:hypothetical protein AJ79_07191 [Helicocarpus griseus UAMH5409]
MDVQWLLDMQWKTSIVSLEAGIPPTIPGAGVLYTAQYIDRSQYSYLETLPNSLPLEENAPELFLAPQGKYPVSGRAWGIRLGYNCSVVKSATEFTILNLKDASGRNLDENAESPSGANYIVEAYDSEVENLLSNLEVGRRFNASYIFDDGNEECFSADEATQNAGIFEFAFWQKLTAESFGYLLAYSLASYSGADRVVFVVVSAHGKGADQTFPNDYYSL